MTYLLAYIAVMLGLLVVVDTGFALLQWAATGKAPRPFRGLDRRLQERRDRRRPKPEPLPPVLYELELRRLGGECQRIIDSDLPAKAMRLRACTAAYDYVLLECCRSHELEVPAHRVPLTSQERFDAESSLISAGVSW